MFSRPLLGLVVTLLAGAILAPEVGAADSSTTPVQLALFSPVQIFSEDRSVAGLRLSVLLGVNQDVAGLDIAAGVTRTEGTFRGVQLAMANQVEGDCKGLQFGLTNEVDGLLRGIQISALGSNVVGGSGAQISALWNWADSLSGVQIGVLNFGGQMKGLQLGLLNFNDNGFLPVFPLFNFGF